MRKLVDLKAEEFPGVDPAQFAQWKVLRAKGEKTMLFLIIGISVVLLLIGVQGAIGYFLIAFLIVLTPLLARVIGLSSANRYAQQIGLKEESVRAALKK
jgi:hypothetical protein